MFEELKTAMSDSVAQSTLELLDAYGLALVDDEVTSGEDELVGVIGFTAKKLRGNLVLSVSRGIVRDSQQGAEPEDWTGELTNQLIGRLKNKLLPVGVALEISTPIVVSGLSIRIKQLDGTEVGFAQGTTSGGIQVLVNVRASEGFVLEPPSADSLPPAEGDLLLF